MPDLIEELAAAILQVMHEPALVLDGNLKIRMINPPCQAVLRGAQSDITGRSLDEVMNGNLSRTKLAAHLQEVIAGAKTLEKFALNFESPSLGHCILRINARRLHPSADLII